MDAFSQGIESTKLRQGVEFALAGTDAPDNLVSSAFPEGIGRAARPFRRIRCGASRVRGRLVLAEQHVQVKGDIGGLLRELSYTDIKSATYSRSKHPRWKSGLALTAAFGVFAVPMFFLKAKNHWLTLQSAEEYIILRLDKKNYHLVLNAVETAVDLDVERLGAAPR